MDNEFFSDGLTEEIITDLSGVKALRVISRNSSMQRKGSTKPLPEIGKELGVRYLITGGVRKAGNALRITTQLVDATTDSPLWAEKYSGTRLRVIPAGSRRVAPRRDLAGTRRNVD